MTERADRSRRHRSFSGELESLGQDLRLGRERRPSQDAGDDLVRILVKLTDDLERFDSMVVLHRQVLEGRAGARGTREDAELNRRSERISLEAQDMVTYARQALEELRRLGEPTKTLTLSGSHRNRSRGLVRGPGEG